MRITRGLIRLWVFTTAIVCLVANVSAATSTFSCDGEVALLAGGKQVNPVGEKSSMSVKVDLSAKALTVDGVTFPTFGRTDSETIVAMEPNKGSVTFNRITGVLSAHLITYDGLRTFYGKCLPAKPLF